MSKPITFDDLGSVVMVGMARSLDPAVMDGSPIYETAADMPEGVVCECVSSMTGAEFARLGDVYFNLGCDIGIRHFTQVDSFRGFTPTGDRLTVEWCGRVEQ